MLDHISNLLGEATIKILHKQYTPSGSHPLSVRVGSGRRTCHQFDRLQRNSVITYGKKAINDKIQNGQKSLGYTTAKEIKQYGFFNGKITTKNLLVAVVLHEYAHYIQVLNGQRYRGSVHNDHFYEILNDLHYQGYANEVKSFLDNDPVFNQLPDEKINEEANNLKEKIKTGDKVSFTLKSGKKVTQRVIRLNQKTVSTETYRISYSVIDEHIPKSEIKDNNDIKENLNNKNIIVGNYIKFTNSKNQTVTAKVSKVNLKTVSCNDGRYKYKVPFHFIQEQLTENQLTHKPVIKDRDYFSHLKSGDEIKFNNRGKTDKAIIIRLNQKRATCKTDHGELYIPYTLIMD
tara:strand:- start:11939 stop:12976 length:1038 start_codon:yes stop_codon:yes gene_type:complete